jgi:opacity protein-like surface antigen
VFVSVAAWRGVAVMSTTTTLRRLCLCLLLTTVTTVTYGPAAHANPVFARQYDMSCNSCHAAFPRLNAFGEYFRDHNMRLPNWREKTTVDTGDKLLALPKTPPLAIRTQSFAQAREGKEIDPVTGVTSADSAFDIQAPYLLKLFSSAPVSEHMTYYFYGIFAEKGGNGETIIEDAWVRHDDVFGSGVGVQFGQFQTSDLMFPRETRLTFQDFMAYRMAGITYDRGLLFDREFGPISLALGVVNGNGITQNWGVNSPGYRRPDHLFDNNTAKNAFGRVGVKLGKVKVGLFGLSGDQKSATGPAANTTGTRDTDKQVVGLDLSGEWGGKGYWFVQGLWNRWDGILDADPTGAYSWFGSFAGVDYVLSDRWALSALYNYADAGDFKGTATVYEGINMQTLTLGASYYFMRNVKGVIEVNYDFLSPDQDADFVGHESKEGYVLLGIDMAF